MTTHHPEHRRVFQPPISRTIRANEVVSGMTVRVHLERGTLSEVFEGVVHQQAPTTLGEVALSFDIGLSTEGRTLTHTRIIPRDTTVEVVREAPDPADFVTDLKARVRVLPNLDLDNQPDGRVLLLLTMDDPNDPRTAEVVFTPHEVALLTEGLTTVSERTSS